jgi:Arc/MetJ-type ribon-helix-helix transcriptional regulator
MNAIVKKAFAKVSELPKPLQETLAKKIVANIEKWQALRRDVAAGFASGPATPFDAEAFKRSARRRLSAKRKRNARG